MSPWMMVRSTIAVTASMLQSLGCWAVWVADWRLEGTTR